MGVTRHKDVLEPLTLLLKLAEERHHPVGYLAQLVAYEELQVYEHLVVARPSAVYLLAHVAQTPREQQLHL